MTARRTRLTWWALPALLGLLAAAACAPSGAETAPSAGGSSVPPGSSPQEYAAALEGMEPITLQFGGLTSGPESPTVAAYVEYGDLVEEWSGGKITFEYDFAGAKVPIDEMADGLSQGRVDMGTFIPGYQPDEWPVFSLVTAMGYLDDPSPLVGKLASLAAKIEFGYAWSPLQEEAARHGVVPIIPLWQNHDSRMHCVSDKALESLADLQGKRIRVAEASHVAVAEALGMVPVSMVNSEMYTGLQRGVVDCAVNGVGPAYSQGYYDVVNSWTFGDPQMILAQNPISWGISQRQWEKLPLAAQQLLWDTLPNMIELQVESAFSSMHESLSAAHETGMPIGTFAGDVVEAATDHYAKQEVELAARIEAQGAAENGEAVIEQYEQLHDKWASIVAEDLGFPAGVTWQSFVEEFDPAAFDVKPLVDQLYDEVLLPRRPE